MPCERCDLGGQCSVLNKQECPINKLWEKVDEAKAVIAEVERILTGEV